MTDEPPKVDPRRFARVAMSLGFVTAAEVSEAAAACRKSKGLDLEELLVQGGILSPDERDAVQNGGSVLGRGGSNRVNATGAV